jgi:guanine deaminase
LVLSASDDHTLTFHRDGAVAWNALGQITYAGDWKRRPTARVRWQDYSGQVITPGFCDVHSHLPQYPMVARGGLPLLPWLEQYIFPAERQFNAKTARVHAPLFFQELKRNGITSAALYTAVYEASCDVCFEAAEASGLRVVMGKMMMDVGSYSDLEPKQILRQSLAESERLCARWHGKAEGRLRYAFSPRFAVTCSQKLMTEVGRLAAQSGAFIQTHLAENREELALVRQRFPNSKDYTEVYEQCGMLGPKTIVGHAIHLSAREYRALALTDTKVAHCPSANLFLGSGVMAAEKMAHWNIAFGLGSDVGAGPELSPWAVMKAARYAHAARRSFRKEAEVFSPVALFYAATGGGASVLDQAQIAGQLKSGFSADIAVWNVEHVRPYDRPMTDLNDGETVLSQMIYRGEAARVSGLWVKGVQVLKSIPS